MASSFQIQGKTFRLKPFSPGNKNRLLKDVPEWEEEMQSDALDYFEYTKKILGLIADGPIDQIDCQADDYDAREVEDQLLNFIPPSYRQRLSLLRF